MSELPAHVHLGGCIGSDLDTDLMDLPRYKTVRELIASLGTDAESSPIVFMVVTKHTMNAGRTNPHFVVLTDAVPERLSRHSGFHCTCGSAVRCGVPCRHFWAVLLSSPLAGFHFGMVNELWFCSAQPMIATHKLYAFDGLAEEDYIQADFTSHAMAATRAAVSCEPAERVEAMRLDISKKREYGNLLGKAKKLIETAVESGRAADLATSLDAILAGVVSAPPTAPVTGLCHPQVTSAPIILNPEVAKPRGRPPGAKNKQRMLSQQCVAAHVQTSQPVSTHGEGGANVSASTLPRSHMHTSCVVGQHERGPGRPPLADITEEVIVPSQCSQGGPVAKRKRTCKACGGEGHRRDNVNCPMYRAAQLHLP